MYDAATGNPSTALRAGLAAKAGVSYTYNGGHAHAAAALGGNSYQYDANGNMTCRHEGGQEFVQAYNAENRLATVTLVSGGCASPGSTQQSWTFAYDGDGNRVSQAYFDGSVTLTTLYFFGGLYETTVETSAVKKYYAIAGQIVAMNDGAGMKYLLTDHLGSVVAVTNATGGVLSQTRYQPFGQVRTDQFAPGVITQTDFAYTGQRNVASLKLMDYKARMYDAALGRFIQPDTIVPRASNPQSFNRYSYVTNAPIMLIDPSGHDAWWCETADCQADYAYGHDRAFREHSKEPPTSLDPSKLTSSSNVTGIGGAQLYALYLQLWKTPGGWWWQTFGSDRDFSIWDFLSMTAYYEAGGHTEFAPLMAEGGVRWYYGVCSTTGSNCGSTENVVNWWGAYSQSAAGMYKLVLNQHGTPPLQGGNPAEMSIFGDSFRNPPAGWTSGWAADRPYGWANTGHGIWSPNAVKMFRQYPNALFVNFDTFIIASGCAWLNWERLQNQNYCPDVP